MTNSQQIIINKTFSRFINDEVLPFTQVGESEFWAGFKQILRNFTPRNNALLQRRKHLQQQIDEYHQTHQGKNFIQEDYIQYLYDIGYILKQEEDFQIETTDVDFEVALIAGPQLVVPVNNARFALNAANARWGSLYDALYGTDVIDSDINEGETVQKNSTGFSHKRADKVIAYAKNFLDQCFPCTTGSHTDVSNYFIDNKSLCMTLQNGEQVTLKNQLQLLGYKGLMAQPSSILLVNNGLHVELQFDPTGKIGATDIAAMQDIIIESALTTIIDFEDSVTAVDAEDKLIAYRNWLGLMRGNLSVSFTKKDKTIVRQMESDRQYTDLEGNQFQLSGTSLLFARNVGQLMNSELLQNTDIGVEDLPEGIIDAVVTSLIGSIDLNRTNSGNSQAGSIYIVKPKMHGPEEVEFTCKLFAAVEQLLKLKTNTIKLGIMDEERRTTVNLKECIRAAKHRVIFINTGFLDRTGDEIHTSMYAGAFLPKAGIKQQPWISAYEDYNVDVGLSCGFHGRAQIGKGMWAMPDEMKQMMKQKIEHPKSGANTAWVPSPTAATLHALHYHQTDVQAVQKELASSAKFLFEDILTIPLMPTNKKLTAEDITTELENNIQGILGYVVRWVEQGIGCSKVPDIHDVGLMEDRATLRISSQHIANWLFHGICTENQIKEILIRMARIVDQQNSSDEWYIPMSNNTEQSLAFQAASALIFSGIVQPNGYTEPILHHYRKLAKAQAR